MVSYFKNSWLRAGRFGAIAAVLIASSIGVAVPTQATASNIYGKAVTSAGVAIPSAAVDVIALRADGSTVSSTRVTAAADGTFDYYFDFAAYPNAYIRVNPDGASSEAYKKTIISAAAGSVGTPTNFATGVANISGTLKDSNGSALGNAQIQVQPRGTKGEGGNFDYLQTDSSGTFKYSLDFAATPSAQLIVIGTSSMTGATTSFSLSQSDFQSNTSIYVNKDWQLKAPNISGIVNGSDNAAISGVQIYGYEIDNNGQTVYNWPYATSGSDGSYKYYYDFSRNQRIKLTVKPPTGVTNRGNQTDFVFTAPEVRNLTLSDANVSGIVYDTDGTTPITNAQISFFRLGSGNAGSQPLSTWLVGAVTNSQGAFGVSVDSSLIPLNGGAGIGLQITTPSGYTGSGGMTIKRYCTGCAISTTTGLSVVLDSANAVVNVKDLSGTALPHSWVSLTYAGVNAQSPTGSSGKAAFRLLNSDGSATTQAQILARTYTVVVSTPWDRGGEFSAKNYTATFTLDSATNLPTLDVTLLPPNLKLSVTQSGTALGYAGIEVRDVANPSAYFYTTTDVSGNAQMNLIDGSYSLSVRPNAAVTDARLMGSKEYAFTLTNGAVSSFTYSGNPVGIVSSRYPLTASTPNFAVQVTDGTNPVTGGWVEVLDTRYNRWVMNSNIRYDGKSGMNLPNGVYRITAKPAQGVSLGSSSPCEVTVAGGSVSTTTCGAPSGGLYPVTLPSPNFVVTVKNPASTQNIENSVVCAGIAVLGGMTCTMTNGSGVANFSIPAGLSAGTDITYQVSPPFGSTYSGVRGTVARSTSTLTVPLTSPNVKVVVTATINGTAYNQRYAWVNILQRTGSGFTLVAGGSTDGAASGGTGTASLSVPGFTSGTSSDYCVAVYPNPTYTSAVFGPSTNCSNLLGGGTGVGTTGDPKVVPFALPFSNVSTVVLTQEGVGNKFGYVRIEQGGSLVGSAGLNTDGRLYTYLATGTYSMTFYPGPGAVGVPVTRTVVVSGATSDLPTSITLDRGNVSGTVTSGGLPVSGGLVVATSGGQEVTSAVASDGTFMLALASGTWAVKLIPPPGLSGTSTQRSVTVSGSTASPAIIAFEVA